MYFIFFFFFFVKNICFFFYFFFFSSRRRHTRWPRDWSSDVCSSDLISTRGFVDTDQNVMIGGFISGNGIVRVVVRGLGPTLSQFGVPNVLVDPTLELRDGQGTLLTSNDNWQDSQQAEIQASGFAPPDTNESAIIIVRPAENT